MRFVLAGLAFLLTLSTCFAQATVEVESIGFNSSYRPDCFTPMVIRVPAKTALSGDYEIRIKQKDVDSDEPTYVRTISITGGENAPEQRFAMGFFPQPMGTSLPISQPARAATASHSIPQPWRRPVPRAMEP